MSNTVIKQRLSYIDIAKGLLICCLLYGHMIIFARMEGLDDSIMGFIQKCAIYYLFVYVIMLVVMYLLIKLIYDTKYLQWMVGKW